MAIEILMPALSPTMEEGTLAKWLVKEGDSVESGDILAEIETDKATMEFEAVDEGTIGKIVIAGIKVNAVIAVLLEEGEDASAIDTAAKPQPPAETPAKSEAKPAQMPAAAPAPAQPKGERVFATPLARRIAADKGVDLKSLQGSGPQNKPSRISICAARSISTACWQRARK